MNQSLRYATLPLLLGACAALPPEDKPAPPKTAAHIGCATAMESRQASCSPDLLRMQGSECMATTQRVVDRCQDAPAAER